MPKLQFDVVDLINTARGFQQDQNYSVFPNDITRQMVEEYERLYAMEDLMLRFFRSTIGGAVDTSLIQEMKAMLGLREKETSLLDFCGTLRALCVAYFTGPTASIETERRIRALLGLEARADE
jgi:hypothetical protein